jgi:hypothetical protein
MPYNKLHVRGFDFLFFRILFLFLFGFMNSNIYGQSDTVSTKAYENASNFSFAYESYKVLCIHLGKIKSHNNTSLIYLSSDLLLEKGFIETDTTCWDFKLSDSLTHVDIGVNNIYAEMHVKEIGVCTALVGYRFFLTQENSDKLIYEFGLKIELLDYGKNKSVTTSVVPYR